LVVDLGGAKAAANPLGVPLSGLPAKAVTRGHHLAVIPANRVRVAADWLLDAVLSRQTVQLGLVRGPAVPLGSTATAGDGAGSQAPIPIATRTNDTKNRWEGGRDDRASDPHRRPYRQFLDSGVLSANTDTPLYQALGYDNSPAGYLQGTLFALLGPLLLVMAVAAGARAIVGDEEEAGTLELLLAHPVSRTRLLTERFGVLAAAVALLGLVVWGGPGRGGRRRHGDRRRPPGGRHPWAGAAGPGLWDGGVGRRRRRRRQRPDPGGHRRPGRGRLPGQHRRPPGRLP
jgi:ABC-2 family transporter protein